MLAKSSKAILVAWNVIVTVAVLFLLRGSPSVSVAPQAGSFGQIIIPPAAGSATSRLDRAIDSCHAKHCFLFVPPGFPVGAPSHALPETITMIDLRQESVRILRGASPMTAGTVQQFAGRPSHSGLVVDDAVPETATNTQDQAIAGLIDNASPRLNAVGVWGGARSTAPGARIWGGFFNVSNQLLKKGQDTQLVALELDSLNYAKPGVSPNDSKVGLQIVGLGTSTNTNAVEILSNGAGNWQNGIVFDQNSVSLDGTLLGEAGKGPYKLGIDFSNASFTDAAVLVGEGQKIRLNTEDGGAAVIYTKGETLVIQAPSGGIEFTNAQGQPVSTIP